VTETSLISSARCASGPVPVCCILECIKMVLLLYCQGRVPVLRKNSTADVSAGRAERFIHLTKPCFYPEKSSSSTYKGGDMLADHHDRVIHPRTRLIIAGVVGLLMALVVTVRIALPSLDLLAQFSQFSLLVRVVIMVKLLSPLLCFWLVGGWVWLLLLIGEMLLTLWERRESARHVMPEERLILQNQRPSHYMAPSGARPENSTNDASQGTNLRARLLAVPPLFQVDPANPSEIQQLPMMPRPMTNPARLKSIEKEEERDEEQRDAEEDIQEKAPVGAAEQATPSQREEDPPFLQQEAHENPMIVDASQGNISLQKPGEPPETPQPVMITLLKHMRVWVRADDGTTLEVKLRGGENAIRLIQLAYIAWRQGAPVDRDKLLTHVLSRGKRQDMTVDQLGEIFDAAKRYLRQDLDRTVHVLQKHGHPVSGDIDFFESEPGFYSLHSCCKVVDLAKIEEYYRPIQIARKEGLLDEKRAESLPGWVLEACQKLIEAYPGDFLQVIREKFADEFGVWVKEPVTFYRDRYLDALLILANYESALGKNSTNEDLSFEQNEEQRRHIGRAAQLFYDYAMYSINTRADQKLKFAYRYGKDGERVVRAARAIRRCVVELGKLGNPDMIDQVYLAFKERMATLSEDTWKPDKNTESDVAEAKRTTSAYRFSSQIPIVLHENKNEP
jgi:hypothetical protein